jgi:hypothetical protein
MIPARQAASAYTLTTLPPSQVIPFHEVPLQGQLLSDQDASGLVSMDAADVWPSSASFASRSAARSAMERVSV